MGFEMDITSPKSVTTAEMNFCNFGVAGCSCNGGPEDSCFCLGQAAEPTNCQAVKPLCLRNLIYRFYVDVLFPRTC